MADSYLAMQREIEYSSWRDDIQELLLKYQEDVKVQIKTMNEHYTNQIQSLVSSVNEIKQLLQEERGRNKVDPSPSIMKQDEVPPVDESKVEASPEPRRRNTFSSSLSPEILKMRRNTMSVSPLSQKEMENVLDEDRKRVKKMKKKAEREEKKAEKEEKKEEKKKRKLEKKKSEASLKKRDEIKEVKHRRKKSYFKLFRFSTKPRGITSDDPQEKINTSISAVSDYSDRFSTDSFRETSYHRWNHWTKILRKNLNIPKDEDVELSHMELTQLPESFVLTKMKSTLALNVSCNLFEVWPPELVSASIVELTIAANNIREIPPEITKLPNLRSLCVGGNKISYIPTYICELASLEYLDISNNSIAILPDEISKLSNLKEFLMFGNKLEAIPSSFNQLIDLEFVDLSFNSLSEISLCFSSLLQLRHLDFSYNLISHVPMTIANLGALKYFSVRGNKLESLPYILTSIPKLERVLRATDNPYTKAELLEASMKGDDEIVEYLRSNKGGIIVPPEEVLDGPITDEKDHEQNSHPSSPMLMENFFEEPKQLSPRSDISSHKEINDDYDALEEQFKTDLTGMMDHNVDNSFRAESKSYPTRETIINDDINELEKLVEETTVSKPRDFHNDLGRRVSLKRLISAKTVDLYRTVEKGTASHLNEIEKKRIEEKIRELSIWGIQVIEKELIPEVLLIKKDISSITKRKEELVDILLGLDLMKRIVESALPNCVKDDIDHQYNINTVENHTAEELINIISESVAFVEAKYKKMVTLLQTPNNPKLMDIIYCVKELRAGDVSDAPQNKS